MRLSIFRAMAAASLLLTLSCGEERGKEPDNGPGTDPAAEITFAKGADVSWVSEMEKDGKVFRKADGSAADIFAVLSGCGINSIRLRVWVDPYGGWSGKADMVALAKRAAAAGMAVMADFHYSDFFADPSRQKIPAAWEQDKADLDKMCSHVSAHTKDVLEALKAAGVSPRWIQVGNETRNGMLWPAGQLWDSHGNITDGHKHFAQLYNAGYDAAKAVFPDALVMPHLDNAFEDNMWWFNEIKAQGARFDAIALSHYPQAGEGQAAQKNRQALDNIKKIHSTFGIPVIVSEVGVKPALSDAASVLKDFIDGLRAIDGCEGVFYWEPEVYGGWKPAIYSNPDLIYRYTGKRETWNAYDQGAFTSDGRASAIMDAFKD